MVEKKGMGLCAITTGTSQDSFHVMRTSFAQVQQAKKKLLKVPMHIHCCAQVSYNHGEKLKIQQVRKYRTFFFSNTKVKKAHFWPVSKIGPFLLLFQDT